MKKKVISTLLATAMVATLLAGCGSSAAPAAEASAEPAATEEAAESGVYTVETDNFESWDYSFVNINAFGDTAGVGMLNIQSWGNKKLALGDDGTCDGVGCKWTIKLESEGIHMPLMISLAKILCSEYTCR